MPPFLATMVILVLWEAAISLFDVPRFILPRPSAAIALMFTDFGYFRPHIWITLQETVFGFVLAVALSVPTAVMIVSVSWLEKAFFPLLVWSQVVPKMALAPLFLIWLGFGISSKILMVLLLAFFPILLNAMIGLKSLEIEKRYLAQSIGASRLQMFWRIQLPAALPVMFAGLKVGVTLALIGAVVGEFVGAAKGLGRLLILANSNLDTALLFAAVGWLSILGVGLYLIIDAMERLSIPWHVSQRPQR
ncbi:MAG: ABC transporter permease subunit [Actinobacteria bacterium]|nr:ABC transporter permease subunit [Actinomycetota bacterium]